MIDASMQIIIIIFAISVGIPIQLFLSKKKYKYVGLVLPIIAFIASLRRMFNLLEFELDTVVMLGYFVFLNIPTIIFFLIYILSKKSIKQKSK